MLLSFISTETFCFHGTENFLHASAASFFQDMSLLAICFQEIGYELMKVWKICQEQTNFLYEN